MPQVYNPGSDIIEAYLKGIALRQEREKYAAQQQMAQMELERKNARDEELQRQFQERMKQREIEFKALEKYRTATSGIQKVIAGLQFAKGQAEGTIQNPGQVDEIIKGSVPIIASTPEQMQALRNKRLTEEGAIRGTQAVATAVDTAKALAPIKQQEQDMKFGQQVMLADAQRAFTEAENKKNRIAARENALLRAQATMANAQATREDRKRANDDYAQTELPNIFDGTVVREELKGQPGLATIDMANKNKIRILNKEERKQLESLRHVKSFYEQAAQLKDIIAGKSIPAGFTSDQVEGMQRRLMATIETFGREIAGMKGVVSDRDIIRLQGMLPQVLPAGWRTLPGKNKTRMAENEKRIQNIEKYYFDAVHGLMKNISPTQRKAMEKTFDIMPEEEDLPDANAKK